LTRGTIFHKSVQLLAYTDDADIIGRSEHNIKKTFTALKTAADAMGLSVNQEKTKYMVANCKSRTPHAPHIHISDYNFERVSRFVYLVSLGKETNVIKEEISKRIQNANRCYYGLLKHFKLRLLTHETKCRLHTTLVRPVLTYASETWMLTQSDMAHLNTFEGKY
jgi:hypothetical protein